MTPGSQNVREWNVPSEVRYGALSGETETRYRVYPTAQNFLDELFGWQGVLTTRMTPRNLIEATPSAGDLYTKFFLGGASLAVVDVQVALYATELISPLSMQTLEDSVAKAIEYVTAESYPERRDLYFALLESIGSAVVVGSTVGGSIEKSIRLNPSVWDVDLGGKLPNLDWIRNQVDNSLYFRLF